MASSTGELLRITVAALMHACSERQPDLALGLKITQGQVSRKMTGGAAWSLDDIDRLSGHYGIPVPDLLAGPTHAINQLAPHRRASVIGGTQVVISCP